MEKRLAAELGNGGADQGTSVRVHIPDPRLQSYVTFFYFVEVAAPLDDFLYPEWGNVRFGTGGSWQFLGESYPTAPVGDWLLFGPTDRAARIVSERGGTVGFGLTPLGWERLVGTPADALANRVTELGELLGVAPDEVHATLLLHERDAQSVALLEGLLLDRLGHCPPNSELAMTVDRVLRDRPHDVEEFGERAGLSRKVLSKICQRTFGFGPKRLLRRQRFLDTLGRIRITQRPHFTTMIDPEYVDQSHFVREFRAFMGLSPRAYLSAPRPLMAQAALAQAGAGIPLSFKLPEQPQEPTAS